MTALNRSVSPNHAVVFRHKLKRVYFLGFKQPCIEKELPFIPLTFRVSRLSYSPSSTMANSDIIVSIQKSSSKSNTRSSGSQQTVVR